MNVQAPLKNGRTNCWTPADYMKVGILGLPPRSLGGIDVTYRCNLRCRHCYFIKQGYDEELSLEQWLWKFEDLRREGFPFLFCGWIGGEPLLRKDVVELGKSYFKTNVVFTNGTISLPDWPDVTFSVSIHGTESAYCQMTGSTPTLYKRIKENVDKPDLKVVLAFCVTRINQHCIEEMLEEWSKTSVKGIVFEFYTPMKGEGDELWLTWPERDRVIERIQSLRRTYGDFIWVSDRIYRLMKSDTAPRITQNCPFPRIGFSFDPMGREKHPCQLGPDADCTRCGCILPFFSALLTHKSLLIPEFASSVFKRVFPKRLGLSFKGAH